jgi:hypothetical protein
MQALPKNCITVDLCSGMDEKKTMEDRQSPETKCTVATLTVLIYYSRGNRRVAYNTWHASRFDGSLTSRASHELQMNYRYNTLAPVLIQELLLHVYLVSDTVIHHLVAFHQIYCISQRPVGSLWFDKKLQYTTIQYKEEEDEKS